MPRWHSPSQLELSPTPLVESLPPLAASLRTKPAISICSPQKQAQIWTLPKLPLALEGSCFLFQIFDLLGEWRSAVTTDSK